MSLQADVAAVTGSYVDLLDETVPGLVGGVFLHGSLCWGEFFADSDIDVVSTLTRVPTQADLAALASVHASIRDRWPGRRLEGFYCRPADLADPPSHLATAPAHAGGAFHPSHRIDINPVTWHELAERAVVVRGVLPPVHTDLDALLRFTVDNLGDYWEPQIALLDADPGGVGVDDAAVAWVTLGVARLHHLLATRTLTSKSGAGRYVLETFDRRWHGLAADALAIRETPGRLPACVDPLRRGEDLRDFLRSTIDDARRVAGLSS